MIYIFFSFLLKYSIFLNLELRPYQLIFINEDLVVINKEFNILLRLWRSTKQFFNVLENELFGASYFCASYYRENHQMISMKNLISFFICGVFMQFIENFQKWDLWARC